MTASQESASERQFQFLDLPGEIRNIVYCMFLVNEGATFPRSGDLTSVTSVHHLKRASAQVPNSALDILLVNRLVHREAYPLFYSKNDLAFATPMRLQRFMLSLGHERLGCLRNVTLFHRRGPTEEGMTSMDTVLCTLRLLTGLRKLHILVPPPFRDFMDIYSLPEVLRCSEANPAVLAGMKTLFSFRNLTDIRVFGPHAVTKYTKKYFQSHLDAAAALKRLDAIFRHLNHGLRLAQKGQIFTELYTDQNWTTAIVWPALGTETSVCGPEAGCLCG